MPSDPGRPTLDQLRVFLTVVDVGSFAGAARRLGRATSVISYSIANLEAQLLPASRVIDALKAFRAEFPTASLRLYVEALGAVTQMVLNRTATIGIAGPLEVEVAG